MIVAHAPEPVRQRAARHARGGLHARGRPPTAAAAARAGIPVSRARSRRKASVELASVNRTKMPMAVQNRAGSLPGGGGAPGAAARRGAGSRAAGTRGAATAARPGTAASRKTDRSFSKTNLRRKAASSGPATAPALSIARCRPNARPAVLRRRPCRRAARRAARCGCPCRRGRRTGWRAPGPSSPRGRRAAARSPRSSSRRPRSACGAGTGPTTSRRPSS